MLDKKEKIINEMLKRGANQVELFSKLGFAISMDITKAISPVNIINAPLIIAYLEGYAAAIRERFPEAVELADELKKAKTITIATDISKKKS